MKVDEKLKSWRKMDGDISLYMFCKSAKLVLSC